MESVPRRLCLCDTSDRNPPLFRELDGRAGCCFASHGVETMRAPIRVAKGRHLERGIESVIFGMRWIMAPVYLALMSVLVLLAYRFFQELAAAVPRVPSSANS